MLGPITILIVDDDKEDIEMLIDIAHSEIDSTINFITSQNGYQCLSMLANITPDLIFLDINMPLMGGKECFEKLKKRSEYKTIPIVVYSTSKIDSEIQYYKEYGASYLRKPDSMNDFIEPFKLIIQQHFG